MLPGCGESLFLRDSQQIIEFYISKRGGSAVPWGAGSFPVAFQFLPPRLIPLERQIGSLLKLIPNPRQEFGEGWGCGTEGSGLGKYS